MMIRRLLFIMLFCFSWEGYGTAVFYRYQYLDRVYPRGYCAHINHLLSEAEDEKNWKTNTKEPIVCVAQLFPVVSPSKGLGEPIVKEHIVRLDYNRIMKICFDFEGLLKPHQKILGKAKLTLFCSREKDASRSFTYRSDDLITHENNPTTSLENRWVKDMHKTK